MNTTVLEAQDIRRILSGRVVLASISLKVAAGEVVFVLGPPGSGKTSLLRSLALLDPIQGGTLLLSGRSPKQLGPAAWRARVAYISNQPPLLHGTPSETYFAVQRFVSQRGRPRGDLPALIADLGLDPTVLNAQWGQLQIGEARLVCLAIAVALQPDILLLDDITRGLDTESTCRVEHVLKSCGVALVWVSTDRNQPERIGGRCIALPLGTETLVGAVGLTPSRVPALPTSLLSVQADNSQRDDFEHFVYSPTELLSPRTAFSDAVSTSEADGRSDYGTAAAVTRTNSDVHSILNGPALLPLPEAVRRAFPKAK